MAVVFNETYRSYRGLDADKTLCVGKDGERYAATDTGIIYSWGPNGWRGGYAYVPRATATPDKQVGDFTTDGTWKVDGLDLSAIVPAGAVAVVIKIQFRDDAAGSTFEVRQNATTVEASLFVNTQAVNITGERHGTIPIDANRLMDYFGTNLAFALIDFTVLGWYI